MEVLVFKTTRFDLDHIRIVASALNDHHDVEEWNVDLHDSDRIPGVVVVNCPARGIVRNMLTAAYYCAALN